MPWPVSTTLISMWSFDRLDEDIDTSALRRELDRIRQQIPDHLLQPAGVAADRSRAGIGIEREMHVPGRRQGANGIERRLRDGGEIDGLAAPIEWLP